MNLRDFKIGWRLLVGQPGYSAVVIFGLSIGFAVCFLLLGYVRFSLNYDSDVPQAERLYLMKTRINIVSNPTWYEATPLRFMTIAQQSGLVDAATAVYPQPIAVKANNQIRTLDIFAVNPSFESMFGVKSVLGDLHEALTHPDTVALTQSTARQLFGDINVLDKTVQILGAPFVVRAIVADPKSNSTLRYGALVNIDGQFIDPGNRKDMVECFTCLYANIYVKLKGLAAPADLQHILQDAADHSPLTQRVAPEVLRNLGQRKILDIALGSLRDMYFDDDTAHSTGSFAHGSRSMVFGLAAVAILILLLATTNYVNLATVRTIQRQHEIAVLKVLGASNGNLAMKFCIESVMVATTSSLIGLLLTWLFLPVFSDLVGANMQSEFSFDALGIALGIGIVIGVLSAMFPTWHAIRVRPPHCLSGRSTVETRRGRLSRQIVTVLQFATAIVLISTTLAVAWQTYFARYGNPGFDPSPLLVVVPFPNSNTTDPHNIAMHDALVRIPGVSGVSRSLNPVGLNWGVYHDDVWLRNGNRASLVRYPVSANFFDVYGLRPIAGRLFDEKIDSENSTNAVINVSAVRALGYKNAQDVIGQVINLKQDDKIVALSVVGVAPDIRYENLRESAKPVYYLINANVSVFTLRVSGDMAAVESAAEQLARQLYPNDLIAVRRAGDYLADVYEDDLRLTKILGVTSLIAVAIAAFGLYVLSAYSAELRRREIVIRKIYGATGRHIARLVAFEFICLIGFSSLVALPLSLVTISRYLAAFAVHAPIGGWTLLISLLVALFVTFASTLRHTLLAMKMSPHQILNG